MESNTRKSGIELLRIIAMFQIITLHIFNFGKLSEVSHQIGGVPLIGADLLWAFCRCPVNAFMIISGYFLVDKEIGIKSAFKRILSIYKPAIFYSVVLSAICMLLKPEIMTDSIKENICIILKSLLPVSSRMWYFITNYIFVLALSPFINRAVKGISKKQYFSLVMIIFFIISVLPVLSKISPTKHFIGVKSIVSVEEGKSLYNFIFLYIIGGFLKRFVKEKSKPEFKYLLGYIACVLADFSLNLLSYSYQKVFGWYSNPLVIMQGIFIFLFFRSLPIKSKIINQIAKGVFGVYMIHEFIYVRKFIWEQVNFRNWDGNLGLMLVKCAIIVFSVFVICQLIEQLRLFLFQKAGKRVSSRK